MRTDKKLHREKVGALKRELADDIEEQELALIASGQMTPSRTQKLPDGFWKMGPRLSIAKAAQAVTQDRKGR